MIPALTASGEEARKTNEGDQGDESAYVNEAGAGKRDCGKLEVIHVLLEWNRGVDLWAFWGWDGRSLQNRWWD